MRLGAVVAAVVIGSCALTWAGWRYASRELPIPPAGAEWRYAHEQSWLVGDSLTALRALATLAATGQAAPEAGFAVTDKRRDDGPGYVFHAVQQSGGRETLDLEVADHVFSPAAYAPVARRWLGDATDSRGPGDRLVVETLTDFRLASLHDAHRRVSDAIARDPRSAAAHEQAALVVAALALRDTAAGHTDPRQLLTRMTAHLALARALRAGAAPSGAGRLAHVALLVLSGRHADAVTALGAEPADAPQAERAWARALRLHATGDWRAVQWSEELTLVERLALFKAYQVRIHSDRNYERLETLPADVQALPDWTRIQLNGYNTVADCPRSAIHGWTRDVAEAQEASRLFRNQALADGDVADALNARPAISALRAGAEGPVVEVLDWGSVAAFLQRQLGARLSYEEGCYLRTYGLPDQAAHVLREQEARFGRLELFPLEVHRWERTRAERDRFGEAAVRVLRQHPEVVTEHLWVMLHDPVPFGPVAGAPLDTDWFQPRNPFGTDLPNRMMGLYLQPAEVYDTRAALDPYDLVAQWMRATVRLGRDPSYEQMLTGYGPAVEWDVNAMRGLAGLAAPGSEEKRRWLARACEVEADNCGELAQLQADRHEDAASADTFRKYWREGLDRVGVANGMRWLVEYDRSHDRDDEARQVAEDAGSTASYRGLAILADHDEATGRLDEAAAVSENIAEHYGYWQVPVAFYDRRLAKGEKRWQSARDAAMATLFPSGLESAGTPKGAPVDGLYLWALEPAASKAGLRNNDIIVALDGTRVHTKAQWDYLQEHATDPEMRLVVFRGGAYVEVRAVFEKRKIPGNLKQYPERL